MAITKDNSAAVRAEFMRRLEARMLAAVSHLEKVVVSSLMIGQPVRRGGVSRKAQELAATLGTSIVGRQVGLNPSKPGEPPHTLTGTLRRSIMHRVDVDRLGVTGRVGTNVEYAKFLEMGTRRMAARPYLRPTLFRERRSIAKILGKGT